MKKIYSLDFLNILKEQLNKFYNDFTFNYFLNNKVIHVKKQDAYTTCKLNDFGFIHVRTIMTTYPNCYIAVGIMTNIDILFINYRISKPRFFNLNKISS